MPLAPRKPRPGRPQRPDHQHRLEQQPNGTCQVGVQTERVGLGDELGDVAWEDRDEERGHDPADLNSVAAEREKSNPQDDFHYSGCHDHDVPIEGQPRGHLSEESLAIEGQVTNAGEKQERTEQHSERGAENGSAILLWGEDVHVHTFSGLGAALETIHR